MSIGKRVKELRKELNLTSSKFAFELGIPTRTIGSYERSEVLPGTKFLTALNVRYNVNVNWVLTGKGLKFNPEETSGKGILSEILSEISSIGTEEITVLKELLNNEASKDMLIKFIEIKKGNKKALNELIQNLYGIKAIYD